MARGDVDIFKGQGAGGVGLPDTHARLVGRKWSNAFPDTVFDNRNLEAWLFGQPQLRADNRGWAKWEHVARNAKYVLGADANRQFRHGAWVAHLNGGEQSSGEDWASIWIPVNDMPLPSLDEILWTYYKFLAGTTHVGGVAPNIVISTRNPDNPDERADISQQASHGAAITEGWHDDAVRPETTAYLFWYGNNITSDLTEGSLYTLAQFQVDKAFRHHVVYRIMLDYGFWGSARSTGDVWIGSIQINRMQVLRGPDEAQMAEVAEFERLMFGKPTLQWANNSLAGWVRGSVSPLDQKGSTGWLANLYGGAQSGDDWARVNIPVNEIPVSCFNTAMWSYYMSAAETMGVGIVIWVHDPLDHDVRAEITQLANVAGLEKGAGWNAHEVNQTTDQFFYYGEGIAGSNLTEGAANLYGWDDFQGDECFNKMAVYRITLEYGWEASGTFDDAFVADVKLNGQLIPLAPEPGEKAGTETKSVFLATAAPSTTRVAIITPTSVFKRIRIHSIFMNTASATAAQFEVYFGTGANITSTPANAIAACTLDTDTQAFETVQFGDKDGPIGAPDTVVSIRTGADITTNGNFTIVYHEE